MRGRKRIDLTGQRFNRLTVLGYSHSASGGALWRCLCDCGTETVAIGSQLRAGRHKSCGCLKIERITAQSTTHGKAGRTTRTSTYTVWQNMRRRCKPGHARYADWGGRGITVCDRWDDYATFLEDMGEKPPGMTLERRDNNGPYDATNCYWAPPVIQNRNKRSARLTPEVILRIRDLAADGGSVQEIAALTCINRHAVGTVMATIAALSRDGL